MPDSLPLFAPARASFPCPGLLALASRASLGGARETLLGAVMVVRLAAGARGPFPLPSAARRARAEGARAWLGALTVPSKVRAVLLRAFVASAGDDRGVMADALGAVTDITAPHLDRVARSELLRIAEGLRADVDLLAGTPNGRVE